MCLTPLCHGLVRIQLLQQLVVHRRDTLWLQLVTLPILRLVQLLRIFRIRLISFLAQDLEHVHQAFDDIHLTDRINNGTLDGGGHFVLMDDSGPVRCKGEDLDEQNGENEGLPTSHECGNGVREILVADVFCWEVGTRLCAEREYKRLNRLEADQGLESIQFPCATVVFELRFGAVVVDVNCAEGYGSGEEVYASHCHFGTFQAGVEWADCGDYDVHCWKEDEGYGDDLKDHAPDYLGFLERGESIGRQCTYSEPSQAAFIMSNFAVVIAPFKSSMKVLSTRVFWTQVCNIHQEHRNHSFRCVYREHGRNV